MLTLNGNSTQSHDNHSVAVTGLSCRFPGDGDNLDNFWNSICAGTCMSGLLG
jgi:zearalenone synthase (highly reducing iterative type I polyketide synthase)